MSLPSGQRKFARLLAQHFIDAGTVGTFVGYKDRRLI